MKVFYYAMVVLACYACAPAQTDTQAIDSAAVEVDTVFADSSAMAGDLAEALAEKEASEHDSFAEPQFVTGSLSADGEYTMTNAGMIVSDPFGFSLDTTTLRGLLGPAAVFKYTETPAGKDEMGDYGAYTFFEVESGKTKMSFYSYSGKHYALIYTPVLVMKYTTMVGMTKTDFIDKMGLTGDDPYRATVFTVNDDYGSMSFFFEGDILEHIYVNYEEGD